MFACCVSCNCFPILVWKLEGWLRPVLKPNQPEQAVPSLAHINEIFTRIDGFSQVLPPSTLLCFISQDLGNEKESPKD